MKTTPIESDNTIIHNVNAYPPRSETMLNPDKKSFIVLSTIHLMPKTASDIEDVSMLDVGVDRLPLVHSIDNNDYGVSVVTVPDNTKKYRKQYPDLVQCLDLAKKMDAQYVVFNRDADPIDALPTFEDEWN